MNGRVNITIVALGIILWMITCAGIATHVTVEPPSRPQVGIAPPACQKDIPPGVKNGLGAAYKPLPASPEQGEYIGISDGTFAFDIPPSRLDAAYKCRAS